MSRWPDENIWELRNRVDSYEQSMNALSEAARHIAHQLRTAEDELANRESFVHAAASMLTNAQMLRDLESARMQWADVESKNATDK